ncbi:MAG: hypothetical protein AAGI22_07740 [Planctomycetota bacterium]
MRHLTPLATMLVLASLAGAQQDRAPRRMCSVEGLAELRARLQLAQEAEDVAQVTSILREGKRRLGTCNGYPEWRTEPPRAPIDPTPPSAAVVLGAWRGSHAAFLAMLPPDCPSYGRAMPRAALGGLVAHLAGEPIDTLQVTGFVATAVDQQTSERVTGPGLGTHRGMYGYPTFDLGSGCFPLQGIVARRMQDVVTGFPQFTAVYTGGRFAGRRFVVRDHDSLGGWPDDGGAGYDHGFTAAMMALATQHPEAAVRQAAYDSLMLASDWSISEPAVTNTNYTAKNVWAIAEAYGLSGRPELRASLMEKLRLSILPALLTDFEAPFGEVDGAPGVRFDGLHPIARVPGRCLDGHNVLPWYHSMNAWALVASYAALRDRGDVAEAAEVRPYAIAAVDSLAAELVDLGRPTQPGAGLNDIPIALLLGLWAIADAEGIDRPAWTAAASGLWNAGYADQANGSNTFAAGLYVLWASGAAYRTAQARLAPGAIDAGALAFRRSGLGTAVASLRPSELQDRMLDALATADAASVVGDAVGAGRALTAVELELRSLGLL